MSSLNALSIALVLFLVALGLISAGSEGDIDALWVAGLVLIAVAGAVGPALRFAGDEDEEEES